MTTHDAPAYGLWGLVILNSLVFIAFAFSFFKPNTSRDWRVFGTYSAFIVALFVEMYGIPLTIYFLSGWLQTKFPAANLLTHDAGHLWWVLAGQQGDPHFGGLHLLRFIFLGAGFLLLYKARHVLYEAVHGEVKPADKLDLVNRLKQSGEVVAMDTDVAMNSAAVTLVKGDLRGIARARLVSNATVANIGARTLCSLWSITRSAFRLPQGCCTP